MLFHAGFSVIILGFLGFVFSNSFHRYVSTPVCFLLFITAIFIENQTGLFFSFSEYDLILLRIDLLKQMCS